MSVTEVGQGTVCVRVHKEPSSTTQLCTHYNNNNSRHRARYNMDGLEIRLGWLAGWLAGCRGPAHIYIYVYTIINIIILRMKYMYVCYTTREERIDLYTVNCAAGFTSKGSKTLHKTRKISC